jgi:hypothetical protein
LKGIEESIRDKMKIRLGPSDGDSR